MPTYADRVLENLKAEGEIGLMGLSAAVAEPIAGLGGLYTTMQTGDPSKGADSVRSIREGMTYQPRTEAANNGLQNMGQALKPIGQWIQDNCVELEETTGIPREAILSAPQVAAELIPAALIGKTAMKYGLDMPVTQARPKRYQQIGQIESTGLMDI